MDDDLIMEEGLETENAPGTSGVLNLNGEAWKNRNSTTYTSLLDMYQAADLFSDESMRLYQEQEEEQDAKQQELTEYIFSGQMQIKDEEENMVERIFSEEIKLSKMRDYGKKEEDYTICFAMAEMFFVLLFLFILMKVNAGRRKRREAHAVEIDMES